MRYSGDLDCVWSEKRGQSIFFKRKSQEGKEKKLLILWQIEMKGSGSSHTRNTEESPIGKWKNRFYFSCWGID